MTKSPGIVATVSDGRTFELPSYLLCSVTYRFTQTETKTQKEKTILSFNFIFTKSPVKEGLARSPGRIPGGEAERKCWHEMQYKDVR